MVAPAMPETGSHSLVLQECQRLAKARGSLIQGSSYDRRGCEQTMRPCVITAWPELLPALPVHLVPPVLRRVLPDRPDRPCLCPCRRPDPPLSHSQASCKLSARE